MNDTFAAWSQYISDGGFVMPPLVVGTLLLWFCLGWRFIATIRGSSLPLRQLVLTYKRQPMASAFGTIARAAKWTAYYMQADVKHVHSHLEEHFSKLEEEMKRFKTVIASLVAAAPLTGLLGTVTGMIETFDSLGNSALFSSSGGIAGGISQALITTQMGLVVAIPGLVLGRLLDRKQARLLDELDELKHLAISAREQGGLT
ncbi:MAG: MotA/TolQ/ExbB proton channel family protein [Myxococcota bacterium]